MKKILLYAGLFATTLSFTACDEDFTDWADPQSYAQEDAADAPVNGVIEAVSSAIDLNSVSDVQLVKLVSADKTVAGSELVFTKLLLNGEYEVPFTSSDSILSVTASNLNSALIDIYGSKAYTTRDITATVEADVVKDGVAVPLELSTNEVGIKVTTIDNLPAISKESAYYYVGGYNSWDLANPTPMTDNGDGTYSVTIEVGDGEWFCFAPQSSVDSQNWSALFRAETNGDTNASGFFNSDITSGNSFNITTGGKYKFTISPKDWTYKYEIAVDYIYYAGDANGWGFSPLSKHGNDFVGYYYVKYADDSNTWGFKFCQDASWDKDQYGAGDTAGSIALKGGNIKLAEKDAFYQINVNLSSLTCSLTEISSMSLIGSAVNGDSSWGTDYDLTYNAETGAWEGEYTMTDGEYKIRANHDWATSWGGTEDAMTSDNGANLKISAGTYKFSFKPNCDGKGTLSVVAANGARKRN